MRLINQIITTDSTDSKGLFPSLLLSLVVFDKPVREPAVEENLHLRNLPLRVETHQVHILVAEGFPCARKIIAVQVRNHNESSLVLRLAFFLSSRERSLTVFGLRRTHRHHVRPRRVASSDNPNDLNPDRVIFQG